MATTNQLNYGWLGDLTNPHHDGTTQQIDDFLQAYTTDNAVFNQKKTVVHQTRQTEDEIWLRSQRDPAVERLEAADKMQDAYISAARHIIQAHAGLPDEETTKAEARQCAQVFKDYSFRTDDAYGAESDKIIQMQQNLQLHQAFLTQIGAWTFFTKAVEQAQLVRQYLGERAITKGEFVKGEMKAARRATDLAIADIYKTITALMELVPSTELTALYTQLKGIELYARQYYLNEKAPGSGSGTGSGSGGTAPNPGTGGGSGSGGTTPDPGTGGGGGGNTGGNTGGGTTGGNTGGGGNDPVPGGDE